MYVCIGIITIALFTFLGDNTPLLKPAATDAAVTDDLVGQGKLRYSVCNEKLFLYV